MRTRKARHAIEVNIYPDHDNPDRVMCHKLDNLNLTFSIELLLNMLENAGLITIVKRYDDIIIFRIHPPRAVMRDELWAKMNAERMQSFGIEAKEFVEG